MFEVYVPRSREPKKVDRLEIKISKQSIVLNKKARNLMQAEKLELAYDKDSQILRIRRTDNGINVKKTKVYAKGFLDHFDIQDRGKFVADYSEEDSALYVKIN
jgi:flagellar hook protein FlgE